MKIQLPRLSIFSALIIIISTSSCLSNKNITYFPTLRDSSFIIKNVDFMPKIQKGDILSIAINSSDPQSSALFNLSNAATTGILVERNGTILLPKVGLIKVEGKTKQLLSKELEDSLMPYLKDPIVTIRFLNYRVTVLGEVGRPGNVISVNDRMTILEALALSGDVTNFGNRSNILVLRDSANQTVSKRISINDNSIFSSPYFYLQSNDVLYVEPRGQKAYNTSLTATLIPIISSVVSLILVVYTVFRR